MTSPALPAAIRAGRPLLLLLPPSEGKADGGDEASPWAPDSGAFGAALGPPRTEVARALARAGGGDARLLGVGGDHLERARRANAALDGAPTLPAWRRYTGVVWDHLDPASLGAPARRRIVVVSGLLGLVRGDDPVPDYRLKMGARLPPLGKLSTWWRDGASAELRRLARRRVLIDLLPIEHRAALTLDGLAGVSLGLVDPDGKPGGHAAKAAKGALARALLVDGVEALTSWSDERFRVEVSAFG